MNKHITFLIAATLIASAHIPVLYAAESASFRLYDEAPNYADRTTSSSTNFQMNENGLTWVGMPVAGATAQVVTAPLPPPPPPPPSTGGTGGGSGGGGGGGPGAPPPVPTPTPPPPASVDHPSAPEDPSGPPLVVDIEPTPTIEPLIPSTPPSAVAFPAGEKFLRELHLFHLVDSTRSGGEDGVPLFTGTTNVIDCSQCMDQGLHPAPLPAPVTASARTRLWLMALNLLQFAALIRLYMLYRSNDALLIPGYAAEQRGGSWNIVDPYNEVYGTPHSSRNPFKHS